MLLRAARGRRGGECGLPARDQPVRIGGDRAGPPGAWLRHQAVGHPRGDSGERARATRSWRSRSGWRVTFALCALGPLAVWVALRGEAPVHVSRRPTSRRPSRVLVLTAVGAALATAGPSALGAYLVASAVDVGIAEGTAGLLAAVSSGLSLVVRVMLGARADRRRDYGLSTVVGAARGGVGRLRSDGHRRGSRRSSQGRCSRSRSDGAGRGCSTSRWWTATGRRPEAPPASARRASTSAPGAGPAAFGVLYAQAGHEVAWLAVAVITLLAAAVMWLAARADERIRAI